MQPRCVQVVEIAATLFPSRTMHTRLGSMAIREPDGNSSGLPILKQLSYPYVVHRRMKKNVAREPRAAEPAIPKPLSHARKRLRPTCASLDLVSVAVTPIRCAPVWLFVLLDRGLLV